MIFVAVILFLIPVSLKLKDNFEKWKIDASVNHRNEFINVVLAEIPASIFFVLHCQNWWSLIVVLLMMAFWFWFLFDGFYNLIRRRWRKQCNQTYEHLTWWYTGTDDQDDAKSDNFLQKLKPWQHKTIKIGGIVLFTTLYIILCN